MEEKEYEWYRVQVLKAFERGEPINVPTKLLKQLR